MMEGGLAKIEALTFLRVSVAILDSSGRIVAVNETWKRFGRQNGLRMPNSAVGLNYLEYCQSDEPRSRRFGKELKALLAGRLDLVTFVYPCHSPARKRWFSLVGFPLSSDSRAAVALLHVNLTEMLPLNGRRPGEKQVPIRAAANFERMSGVVERSAAEALTSQLNKMFMGPHQKSAREDDAMRRAALTRRQMEVFRLLGEGKTNKEMARALGLSPNTVKLHVSAILRRLKLKSRLQVALVSSEFNKKARSS